MRPLSVGLLLFALVPGLAAASAGLGDSPSAFVRAQGGSPVAWQLWDAATLRRAQAENKPVYVFIGSALSELSRATCRQSFAQADTAAFLNQNFVCVFVDRETQPAVAAYARFYLETIKHAEGWPAHLWLTPELEPFEGSTYLPPNEEWGKSSFMKVAQQAQNAWATNPESCRHRAAAAVAQLAAPAPSLPSGVTSNENPRGRLSEAADAWRGLFDTDHGGFGDPPKRPEPELLRFLLRAAPADRNAALATLRAIAASALRDPLDGGFFRYAVDPAWRMPYPQKTLEDQVRLAFAFLAGARASTPDAASFEAAARGALDYALSRLARPDGTFAASEDATDDAQSGYYAWTAAEIDAALGADAAPFKAAHGVEAGGNISPDDDLSGRFKGKNILRSAPLETAADRAAAARLRNVRDRRQPAPILDERATAGAHGLLIAALARAGAQLDEPRYLSAATAALAAVQKDFLFSSDSTLRRVRGSSLPAAPDDYAALALGCRELGRAAKSADADKLATRLIVRMNALFFDASIGRYCATPQELPIGIAARPPAWSEAPTAGPLALMAGVAPAQAQALRAALLATLNADNPAAPGDVLLSLAP